MGSTRNTPNKHAGGPKAGGARKQAAPAKKAPAKKAAAPAAPAAPEPTVQVEVRVGGKCVLLQDVRKSSLKYALANGKLSVSGQTADAAEDAPTAEQPVPEAVVAQNQPVDSPTPAEFDQIVAAGNPNEAVEFKADPRVVLSVHDGAKVADTEKGKGR